MIKNKTFDRGLRRTYIIIIYAFNSMRRHDIVSNHYAFQTLHPSDHDGCNVSDEFNFSDEISSFHTSHNRRIKSTELNSSGLNLMIVRRMKRL